MQGSPTQEQVKHLLAKPLPPFDREEMRRWNATLPHITPTSLSFWREMDALAQGAKP